MTQPSMLGPYPVERELGRGGMGIVYLARDPRLNRLVAIKIVPDALALNPENLARFEREARLLAAVNHPNIASIYGIEEAGGQRLLVMEYVAGETLADRIRRGKLPVGESLDYARQIASAIEAAHEAGIVHRDLKPGNVRITPEGVVKVLDFGLAKGGVTSDAEQAQSPTITYSPTGLGVILGTAGYMSPEQARGKPVDKRADVWAFGCVLYECLTARKTFEGETVSDTIARILERDPIWSDLPPTTPPRVRDLLRRCLEKDLKKRQRDIGDVRIEIEDAIAQQTIDARLGTSGPIAAPPAQPRSLIRRYGVPGLLVLLGVAVGIGTWAAAFGGFGTSGPPVKLAATFPSNLHITSAVFSRDGRAIILKGSPQRPDGTSDPVGRLYLRPLDSYDVTVIAGTEGVGDWARSPDGRWLAVVVPVAPGSAERRLMKIALDGVTPASVIKEWSNEWIDLAWLYGDELLTLTSQGSKFVRIAVNGGAVTEPMAIDYGRTAGGYPDLRSDLPGGRGVLMRVEAYGARGYQQDVWVLDAKTGKSTLLVQNGASPYYVAETGHLLFSQGSSLMAVKLDLASLTTHGTPEPVFNGLRSFTWTHGTFDLSPEGHLLFEPGGRAEVDRRIVAVTEKRDVTAFIAERRAYEASLMASSDGRQVAVVVANSRGTFETWTGGLDRPDLRKTIALPADATLAFWSPDSRWLAFSRNGRDLKDGVYIQAADGTGEPRSAMLVRALDEFVGMVDWPRDGSGLVVGRMKGETPEFFRVPVSAAGEPGQPRPITLTKGVRRWLRISHDGQLIAFEADDSGRSELYVAHLKGDGIVGQPLRVSNGGGTAPCWSHDSKRLYFLQPSSQVMVVTIDRNPLRASAPALLHDLRALHVETYGWDILPDGRLLGIERSPAEEDPGSTNVSLNWLSTVRSRLPR